MFNLRQVIAMRQKVEILSCIESLLAFAFDCFVETPTYQQAVGSIMTDIYRKVQFFFYEQRLQRSLCT